MNSPEPCQSRFFCLFYGFSELKASTFLSRTADVSERFLRAFKQSRKLVIMSFKNIYLKEFPRQSYENEKEFQKLQRL